MALKLVRVVRRGHPDDDYFLNVPDSRYGAVVHPGKPLPVAGGNYEKFGEWFTIDERAVDILVKYLAEQNAGCDVEVYNLEKVGHCPAGDFSVKIVSEKGILPE